MSRQRKRRGRPVDGVLLLDKPGGVTSNGALQAVKRLFDEQKAGHTGSLDPLATGMLPICFGNATKFSGFLLDADKHYRVTCRFGEQTDTADAEGAVIARADIPALDEGAVNAALEHDHRFASALLAVERGGEDLGGINGGDLARQR